MLGLGLRSQCGFDKCLRECQWLRTVIVVFWFGSGEWREQAREVTSVGKTTSWWSVGAGGVTPTSWIGRMGIGGWWDN